MKEFMHDEVYTGMTGDGVFAGKPHEVFVGGVPDAADAPPFELKPVEEDTLVKIQQRYDSVVPRLEALFPDGKTLCHWPLCRSRWNGLGVCLQPFFRRIHTAVFLFPLPP